MANDEDLLNYYLALGAPDAARWNLSPAALQVEAALREELVAAVSVRPGGTALNVGIGVGAWDDFVGYHLEGIGSLISLDRDDRICEILAYRQQREGHPNASRVVCADILAPPIRPASLDLVTLVGSTLDETAGGTAVLTRIAALVRDDGHVMVGLVSPAPVEAAAVERALRDAGLQVRASRGRSGPVGPGRIEGSDPIAVGTNTIYMVAIHASRARGSGGERSPSSSGRA